MYAYMTKYNSVSIKIFLSLDVINKIYGLTPSNTTWACNVVTTSKKNIVKQKTLIIPDFMGHMKH